MDTCSRILRLFRTAIHTMVGVSKRPFNPFPTDVMKSAVDICEFWLSFEKSELFDIPSLSSNFIVNKNTRVSILLFKQHRDSCDPTVITTALIFIKTAGLMIQKDERQCFCKVGGNCKQPLVILSSW